MVLNEKSCFIKIYKKKSTKPFKFYIWSLEEKISGHLFFNLGS